ncbi:MAG: hypothetical protein ACE5H8_03010 [Alphaproteobacteria bacterium]
MAVEIAERVTAESVAPLSPGVDHLPAIPLVDIGDAGPAALLDAERARIEALFDAGARDYGALLFNWGDRLSRRWLVRTRNPYLAELDVIAGIAGRPGGYLLNLSYEWFCTTGIGPDPATPGNRMLRTLDWGLEGLGRHVVVARQQGPAGSYFNVTWPGFVGIVTAMAPGRFSAALNQAPMRRSGLPLALDWLRNRFGVWRRDGLPPSHLLRRVFDQCGSFAEAKAWLCETPVCLPALFVLSGNEADEGCVIERLENRAVVHETPACVTNHWLTPGIEGTPRGVESYQRRDLMERLRDGVRDGFSWVTPPILNACTRLAVIANARSGRLEVQGWEANAPATAVFRL